MFKQSNFKYVDNYTCKQMKQLTYVKDGVQYFAVADKFAIENNLNSIVKLTTAG